MQGFGPTLGTANNDAIRTGFTRNSNVRTYVARFRRRGPGGSNLGRIFSKNTSGSEAEMLYVNSAVTNRLVFERQWTTGMQQYAWPNPPIDTDIFLILEWDGRSNDNVPILWINGEFVGGAPLGGSGAFSGAPVNNTHELIVGNRISDGFRVWDGLLSDVLIFDAILSDEDKTAISYNPHVVYEPQSIWVPVSGESSAPVPVAPPLLTNGQAFYGPSVGRGAVALSAPLLASTGLLYAASVGRGSVALSPPLLLNAQTLFAPVVTSVNAALRPPLLTNTSTAYVPELTRGAVALTAPLLANTSEMLAPAVGSGSATISPPLLVSGSVVHAPSVQAGALALSAPLLASAGAVYAPSVSAGAVQVLPPLLASTQIFYAPSVTGGAAAIRPGLLANTSDLYAPFVTAGDITLMPPLLVGSQIFFPPTVGDGALPIIDSAFLRYVVPGKSLAFSVPGQSLTYSVPQ